MVDDGSSDWTQSVCTKLADRLPLRYFRIENSGISAAKNLGLFASRAPLVLFFDDDDVADPGLLRGARRGPPRASGGEGRGARVHDLGPRARGHPAHGVRDRDRAAAVLLQEPRGRPDTRLHLLLGRPILLQAHRSWRSTGRSTKTCPAKEDIELGFRLARHGLKVIYSALRQELHGALDHLRRVRAALPEARACPVALQQPPSAIPRSSATAAWQEALEKWPIARAVTGGEDRSGSASSSAATPRRASWRRSEMTELRELYGWTFEALPGARHRRSRGRGLRAERPGQLHALLARLHPACPRSARPDLHHRLAAVGHEHPRLVARGAQRALDRGRVGHLLLPAQGRITWSAPTRRPLPARTAPGCATTAWTSSSSLPISAWA